MPNNLTPGQGLRVDQRLVSDNGKAVLAMQGDGDLVLYRSSDRKRLWASRTIYGHAAKYVSMQSDGNLVVYGSDSHAYWTSGTSAHPGSHCVLQDNGDLVVRSAQSGVVWSSNTVQNWGVVDPSSIREQDHIYFLKNVASGFHLCSRNESVSIRLPSGTPAEKWFRRELKNGCFALYSLTAARRLECNGRGDVVASPADQSAVDDNTYQQWTFERRNDSFLVRNVRTQRVLEGNTFHRTVDGKQPNDATSQDWELVKTSDGSAVDSFAQAVRGVFEKSLGVMRKPEYRVLEPPAGVDVMAETSSGDRVYVKTLTTYVKDIDGFVNESRGFFAASRDERAQRMVVSSEGFLPDVRLQLETWKVRAFTHEDLTRKLLFFNKGR